MSHRALIKQYIDGAGVPHAALQGLHAEELNARPGPGDWSIQQLVMHLLDSDLVASDRMKRIIAEERPTLMAYDETAWAANLFYEKLDTRMAAQVFHKNRLLTATILAQLPAEAFSRTGLHSERGEVTLLNILQTYVDHLEHHMKFLREKRIRLGKPL